MSERRAPSTTDAADKLQIYWNASSFSKTCQNFPFKHRLQLSNIINRKKEKKEKNKLLLQCIRQFSLGTRHLPRTGWRGGASLWLYSCGTACRQRYVLRGFYAWFSFLWWAEGCLSIWDVFTGSWALASFLLSQDCLTVEFELSVLSNLCHKLWVLSARGKQAPTLSNTRHRDPFDLKVRER